MRQCNHKKIIFWTVIAVLDIEIAGVVVFLAVKFA